MCDGSQLETKDGHDMHIPHHTNGDHQTSLDSSRPKALSTREIKKRKKARGLYDHGTIVHINGLMMS
jgi:hypothetical protein